MNTKTENNFITHLINTAKSLGLTAGSILALIALQLTCYTLVHLVSTQTGTNDEATQKIAGVLLSQLLVVIAFLVLSRRTTLLKHLQPRDTGQEPPLLTTRQIVTLSSMATLAWICYQAIFIYLQQRFPDPGLEQASRAAASAGLLPLVVMNLIGAPLSEEIIIRFGLYGALRRWIGIAPATLLSALAFALPHLSPTRLPYTFAMGVLLALVYERTRALRWPVLLHALSNLAAMLVPTTLLAPLATPLGAACTTVILIVICLTYLPATTPAYPTRRRQ